MSSKTTVNKVLDAALFYALEMNWKVFPIAAKSKVPLKGIAWKEEATTDEKQIREWFENNPERNIAVTTGRTSNIIVMDLDVRNGGTDTLLNQVMEHGKFTDTVTLRTGGGGCHYIFNYPTKIERIKSASNILPGLDSKGDGGYIVVAPSIHPNGSMYTLDPQKQPNKIKIADAPAFWVELTKEKKIEISNQNNITGIMPDKKRQEILEGPIVEIGEQDNTMFKIARTMRCYGEEEGNILVFLKEVNEKRFKPIIADKDLIRIAKSAAKYPPGFSKAKIELNNESFNMPYDYYEAHGFTWKRSDEKDKKVFKGKLGITAFYQDISADEDEENIKIKITIERDGLTQHIVTQPSILFSSSNIISLSGKGFMVTSTNAKGIIEYLTHFQDENSEIKIIKTTSQLGWISSDKFITGIDDEITLDVKKSLKKGLEKNGDLNKWLEIVDKCRKYPKAMIALSAAFSAPLIEILKERSWMLYFYGPSGGGKTAIEHLALSACGNPNETILSYSDTSNSIVSKTAFRKNLIVAVDEKQAARRQDEVEVLIYSLANGKSRGRLNQRAEAVEDLFWKTIIISTGEDSLTRTETSTGVLNRAIQLYGEPISDTKLVKEIYYVTERNYGVAIKKYMDFLINYIKDNKEKIKEEVDSMEEILSELYPDAIPNYIRYSAIISVGYILMNACFFPDFNIENPVELGIHMLKDTIDKNDVDEDTRCMEKFQSFYFANKHLFYNEENYTAKERAGWINANNKSICIFTEFFDRTIFNLGFDPMARKRGWVKKGWIKDRSNGKNKRTFSLKEIDPLDDSKKTVHVIVFPAEDIEI